MPTADFSVQFLVQRNSGSTVIKLTDSSTASTFSAGNFKVTYPDGSVVQNTDYDSPDISSVGGIVNYTLKVNSNNSPLTGNYTILYTIIADSSQDVESKTFNFEWVEPTVSITNTSDVTIPEVKFKDNTTYDQGNFTESYDTWTMSAAAPTTSDVSGSTASGDLSTGARELDVVFATNYYEGDYTPTVTTDFTYTSTVYSYLSVNWTKVATNTFSIKKSQTQAEIVALLNTYKDEISTGQKEEYDYVLSLYSHLIGRAETDLLDGSEDILNELLDYIETTSSYTYQSGPISAFTFISGGSGLSNVVEDLTPQLGGDLDAQGNNINGVGILSMNDSDDEALRVTEVTVTSAQIKASFSSPVELIAAPGAGKFIVPHLYVLSMDYNTTTYSVTSTLYIRYGAGDQISDNYASFFQSSTDRHYTDHGGLGGSYDNVNEALQLFAASSNPTTGDSDVKIKIWYTIESI